MALVSVTGKMLRVNRALTEITGYTPDELLETNFQAHLSGEDLDLFNITLSKLLDSTSRRLKWKPESLTNTQTPFGQCGARRLYATKLTNLHILSIQIPNIADRNAPKISSFTTHCMMR